MVWFLTVRCLYVMEKLVNFGPSRVQPKGWSRGGLMMPLSITVLCVPACTLPDTRLALLLTLKLGLGNRGSLMYVGCGAIPCPSHRCRPIPSETNNPGSKTGRIKVVSFSLGKKIGYIYQVWVKEGEGKDWPCTNRTLPTVFLKIPIVHPRMESSW